MPFVAKKKIAGQLYFYLVKSVRVNGKPRHEIIQYLGDYQSAKDTIERSRKIESHKKQEYLTRLAQLAGVLDKGKVSLLPKSYECIVIDPPWYYSMRSNDETHRNRIPYAPMKLEDIKNLPVPELGNHKGCVLWLWFTNNHILDAAECIRHWGFEQKTILTWVKVSQTGKVRIGTGHWLRNATEHCILATKGKVTSFSHNKTLSNQSTVLQAPRRQHSRKPDEFYEMVEKLCPNSSKLEMFSRQKRDGWDCWGDEIETFHAEG